MHIYIRAKFTSPPWELDTTSDAGSRGHAAAILSYSDAGNVWESALGEANSGANADIYNGDHAAHARRALDGKNPAAPHEGPKHVLQLRLEKLQAMKEQGLIEHELMLKKLCVNTLQLCQTF